MNLLKILHFAETTAATNSAGHSYLCNDDPRSKKKDDYCLDKILFPDFCRLMVPYKFLPPVFDKG